jgi:hypothetical protein
LRCGLFPDNHGWRLFVILIVILVLVFILVLLREK